MLPGRTCLGCRVYAVSPPPAPPPDLLLSRLPRLRTPPPWLCTSTSACCAPGPPPGLALPECVLDRGLASGDLAHCNQIFFGFGMEKIWGHINPKYIRSISDLYCVSGCWGQAGAGAWLWWKGRGGRRTAWGGAEW